LKRNIKNAKIKFKFPLLVVQSLCEIHEVRLIPCPEAARNEPCKVHIGNVTTLEVDYTPSKKFAQICTKLLFVGTQNPRFLASKPKPKTCETEKKFID
jgi:hypothetical protein